MTDRSAATQLLLDLFAPERRNLGNDLVDVLRQYNDNMLQYSATVNSLVTLIASRSSTDVVQQPQGLTMGSLADLLQMHRPTEAQMHAIIQRDTETFVYQGSGEGETLEVCPITHEPFQEGESLIKIRRCGHTFKRAALMEWFGRRRMSCPVCRGTME